MRKLLLGTVMLVGVLLVGCGSKVDAVSQKVIDDIESIGSVTLSDEKLILKIEKTYATLTDKQKEQVTNYATLLYARDEIDLLLEGQAENEVEIESVAPQETFTSQTVTETEKTENNEINITFVTREELPLTIVNGEGMNYWNTVELTSFECEVKYNEMRDGKYSLYYDAFYKMIDVVNEYATTGNLRVLVFDESNNLVKNGIISYRSDGSYDHQAWYGLELKNNSTYYVEFEAY